MTYIPGAAAAAVRARGMDFAEQLKQMNQRKEDECRLALYPELLAALKQMLEAHKTCGRALVFTQSMWSNIETLIAKAEGKS